MIAVLVYRPEAAEGGDMNDPDADRLDGVEVLALIDGQPEDAVHDWLVKLHAEHPTWQFSMESVEPGCGLPEIPPPPVTPPPVQWQETNGDHLISPDGRVELLHTQRDLLMGWDVFLDGKAVFALLSPTEAKEKGRELLAVIA